MLIFSAKVAVIEMFSGHRHAKVAVIEILSTCRQSKWAPAEGNLDETKLIDR